MTDAVLRAQAQGGPFDRLRANGNESSPDLSEELEGRCISTLTLSLQGRGTSKKGDGAQGQVKFLEGSLEHPL